MAKQASDGWWLYVARWAGCDWLLNISLVDLPGFHAVDSKVCRGDQDYGSLLGNDFMRKQQNNIPRVTVLTHCDTNTL